MHKKRTVRQKIILLTLGVILLAVVGKIIFSVKDFIPSAAHIVFHPGAVLQQTNGRTNVLLLGIGGGTHDGPDLTDTIIFASIDWQKNTVSLVSIPRDLWIPDLNTDISLKKINEAYALGEANNQHKGLIYAKAVAQEVIGQPIHYAVRLDFQGFVDAINQIGGVDINVAHTLDDPYYPISGMEDATCGHTSEELAAFTASISASLTPDQDNFNFFPCRYKHLYVSVGPQHMNGETALEFARSRHASGSEGTDFARSARQQLIIEAVRNKLISSAFLNPGKLLGLYNIMKSSIDTDITDTDLGLFLDKVPQLKSAKISSYVIDFGDYTTGRYGLLENAPVTSEYDFSASLIPRAGNGNFKEIQQYVECVMTKGLCTVTAQPQSVTESTKK